ncbi:MAG: glutamate racemase [Verrucomicrobiales bacterium]|nr:glutamate racemase [Verrucomicrobiales bacterium]
MASQKVGFLDSGVGGLSVLLEVRSLLPHVDMHYIGDSAWCPYGTKSTEVICERVGKLAEYLISQDVSLIVVACNSATIQAVDWLRSNYPVPFVGTEPAVKPASARTQTGVIGVLATEASIGGKKFLDLIHSAAENVEVVTQACPGFVKLVENGVLSGPQVEEAVRTYTQKIIDKGADFIVLGCTHYPFLRETIENIVPPGITVIDSGASIARRVDSLLSDKTGSGQLLIETTGDLDRLKTLVPRLLGDIGKSAVLSKYSD